MSPFAADTWSIVGTLGVAGAGLSPFNVAYSVTRNVIVAGTNSSGPVFSWNPGALYRSVDRGATWAVVKDFNAEPGTDGGFVAPVALAVLRDPVTDDERFVCLTVSITFIGSPRTRIRVWTSVTGATWTEGQLLASADGTGGAGITSFATRPRGGLAAPDLEHYVIVSAITGTNTSRGVFKSTDLGITWTFVADSAPIVTISGGVGTSSLVAMPDRHVVLGAHQSFGPGCAHSEDGGQTWRGASPNFEAQFLLAFDPGTVVGCRRSTLTGPEQTRVSCDDAESWPLGQIGPTFGLGSGALNPSPVIVNLGKWEVLLAAAGSPLGTVELVYSDTGGETEGQRASVDTGSGIVSYLSGGIVLDDGHPLFVVGTTGHVLRSSDVATGLFGARIYCVTAPAPGVGFLGFPPPCGDFYNPCPQECPLDPVQPAGLTVGPPPPVVFNHIIPYGDTTFLYGAAHALYGGEHHHVDPVVPVVLGLPEGCGATFINEPCALAQCP